jgi:hypothetical protein
MLATGRSAKGSGASERKTPRKRAEEGRRQQHIATAGFASGTVGLYSCTSHKTATQCASNDNFGLPDEAELPTEGPRARPR